MMSCRWGFYGFFIPLLALPACPQAVVSARSGLIHFSEGSVSLDGQKIEQTFGRFPQMKDGSELSTQEGRAEVILTPGMFVRVGENSSLRMLSSQLQDTRVELLSGSIVVDSENAAKNDPVAILYGSYRVQLGERGRFRIDSTPAQLKVEEGRAEVLNGAASTIVNAGYTLPFSADFLAKKSADQLADALDSWNTTRTDSISENNNAGQATDLSTAMEGWQNDPNAFLGALGASGYIPSLGYPAGSYTPLSSYGVQAPSYYPLTGTGLNSPSSSVWGIGALSPFFGYPRPVLGYYPYPYSPSIGVGSSAFPRHGALGIGPYTHPPIAVRPISPLRTSPGVGRIGGRR